MLKVIHKEDRITLEDKLKKQGLRGHVKVKDKATGKLLVEKDNIITLRTRLFVLKNLFGEDLVNDESQGYINNPRRKICLFKIGQGGADIESSPFQPFIPKFSDEDLAKPVPFVSVSPDKNLDPDLEANPSIRESLTEDEEKIYHLPYHRPDMSVSYYAKKFDSSSLKIAFNKDSNELYAHLTLSINPNEARGYYINEFGLVLAEEVYFKLDSKGNTIDNERISLEAYAKLNEEQKKQYKYGYADCELCSRVTMDTISLSSLSAGLEIEYLVYA